MLDVYAGALTERAAVLVKDRELVG
jgi:hypothetical protein